MIIRKVLKKEMKDALDLVWRVYLKYEASNYPEKCKIEFKKSLEDINWIKERKFYGAYSENNNILGVIATKNMTHIALFYVDEKYQGQGIGRKLYEKVKSLNTNNFFTVNSSLYAHEIYKHLGFVDTCKVKCVNGLHFYPMRVNL